MTQTYIGQSIRRKEDVRFLTGSATYIDDIKLPDMLHAAILRSPHPHAKILGIDPSKALAMAGVEAVITFDDIASLAKQIPIRVYPLEGMEQFLQYPLPKDEVRYVGEAVAVVVAESRYLAEDALDAVDVTYEAMPAVADVRQAMKDEVLVNPVAGTNLSGKTAFSYGDIDQAFRDADYTRKESFKTNRHTGNPLETRGAVASYDSQSGDLHVWGPTKVPYGNKQILAAHLEMEEAKIHFMEPDVGGGFGIKGEFYAEDFLIPFAAIKVGKPVKWIEDRLEHLMAANHSREVYCEVEIAAKSDGTILGMRSDVFGDMGAYARTHGCLLPAHTAGLLTGPYHVPAYYGGVNCVMTNKMGAGTYRAPGFFEGCFIRERLLDMMAQDLGMDPAELRFKNFVQPSEMPYTVGPTRIDGTMTKYDSGDYPSAFQRALDEIGYKELKALGRQGQDGRLHGIGVAPYVEPTGGGPFEGARILAKEGGQVEVYLGITTMGQGHETVMAQICADSLGVPMDIISVFHGNTDYLPSSIGTFGSRATVMAGSAIHLASIKLKSKLLQVAANYLDTVSESLVFVNGQVYRAGAEADPALLDLPAIVQLAESGSRIDLEEPDLEATEYFRNTEYTYPYGTHIAHVAVDPETGMLEILKYIVVEDMGRCINPMTAHGQTVGGTAQGIGGALLEELVYSEDGQLLAGSLVDYLLPTSLDIPNIESVILEDAPSPLNPLGVKGAGEGPLIPTGAALANAVSDAIGAQVTDLPLSPNRIRQLLRDKRS